MTEYNGWIHKYIRYNVDFSQAANIVREMQNQGYRFLEGYYKRQWPYFWIKKYTLVFEAPEEMNGIIEGNVKVTIS